MKLSALSKNTRLKKICLWTAGIVGIYAILGFLAAPPLVRSLLTKQFTKEFGQPVTIRKISINPFTLEARVDGFALADRPGQRPLFAFDELYCNLDLLSVIRLAPVLTAVHLTRPRIHIVRYADHRYNFSAPVDHYLSIPSTGSTPGFSFSDIRIADGSIDFDDHETRARHDLTDINVAIPFLSDLKRDIDVQVKPSFSARIDGRPIELKAKSRPFKSTRETGLEFNLDGLDISKYMKYAPATLRFRIPSGLLDANLFVSFTHTPDAGALLRVSGKAAVTNAAIAGTDNAPLFKFSRLDVDLDSFEFPRNVIDIKRIRLTDPEVFATRASDGKINLATAFATSSSNSSAAVPPRTAPAAAAKSDKTAAMTFSVGEIQIDGGRIHFVDNHPDTPFRSEIVSLRSTVRGLTNSGAKPATASLSFATPTGTSFNATANLSLKPFSINGALDLAKLRIKDYASYYSRLAAASVDDGSLDLKSAYAVTASGGRYHVTLSQLGVSLTSLALRLNGEKQPFVTIASAGVKDASVNLDKHTVVIPQFSTSGGMIAVARGGDGKLDLQKLVPPSAEKHQPVGGSPSSPWTISIGKFAVAGYTAKWQDRKPAKPVTISLDKLGIDAGNLSTSPGTKSKATIHFAVNGKGSVAADAAFGLDPLSVDLKLDAKDVNIAPLRPYIANATNIVVTRGQASVKGDIAFRKGANQGIHATFSGDAMLANFASLDAAKSEDFLKWKTLSLNDVRAATEPFSMSVRSVALNTFYSRLIVNPNGRLNVQDILHPGGKSAPAKSAATKEKTPAAPVPAARGAAHEPPIKIGKVILRHGNINFSDHYIKPHYSANLTDIKGTITGLSSSPKSRAQVKLAGSVNHDAPIDITGEINPLGASLYADIKAAAKGIELSPMTPYAAKYAGYDIEKGKLSLDVHYHIEDQKLTAENHVFLDQLTFGDKVDSPDALDLPILLAVSLLKDRQGQIDIHLPVSGSFNDPQFSIGGIIVKVIVNLITKAVTSPFALLSSAFGGTEQLSYATFDPGSSALNDSTRKKLQTLAKALNDRPGLKLEITGRSDPATDTDGLRHALLRRKVAAEKLKDTGEKSSSNSAREVTMSDSEYAKYLKAVYGDADIKKPRNFIGMAKSLPVPEMEKLLLAHIHVTGSDIRELANRRARAVKDYLVHEGKVPQQRIFIVAPKLTADGIKDKGKASRVDFSLK